MPPIDYRIQPPQAFDSPSPAYLSGCGPIKRRLFSIWTITSGTNGIREPPCKLKTIIRRRSRTGGIKRPPFQQETRFLAFVRRPPARQLPQLRARGAAVISAEPLPMIIRS
ncbi:Hypothetical protein NTJ_08171 [Nesidiocoris tenuis]|nr:Hypothetical protein NTJ_08171 [Nesidiocoris tenuis]